MFSKFYAEFPESDTLVLLKTGKNHNWRSIYQPFRVHVISILVKVLKRQTDYINLLIVVIVCSKTHIWLLMISSYIVLLRARTCDYLQLYSLITSTFSFEQIEIFFQTVKNS